MQLGGIRGPPKRAKIQGPVCLCALRIWGAVASYVGDDDGLSGSISPSSRPHFAAAQPKCQRCHLQNGCSQCLRERMRLTTQATTTNRELSKSIKSRHSPLFLASSGPFASTRSALPPTSAFVHLHHDLCPLKSPSKRSLIPIQPGHMRPRRAAKPTSIHPYTHSSIILSSRPNRPLTQAALACSWLVL